LVETLPRCEIDILQFNLVYMSCHVSFTGLYFVRIATEISTHGRNVGVIFYGTRLLFLPRLHRTEIFHSAVDASGLDQSTGESNHSLKWRAEK
jgi:hypothetical protein